jgi:hypothetical protein
MIKIPSWILIDGNTGDAVCERCGTREKVPLPMPITAFVKWAEYFGEKHKMCVRRRRRDAIQKNQNKRKDRQDQH